MWSLSDALVEIVDGDGNPMETQYYNPGSEIELTCIIRNRSHWSTKTIWMKDQQPLDLFHRPTVRLVKAQKSLLISFLRKDAVCVSLKWRNFEPKNRARFFCIHTLCDGEKSMLLFQPTHQTLKQKGTISWLKWEFSEWFSKTVRAHHSQSHSASIFRKCIISFEPLISLVFPSS